MRIEVPSFLSILSSSSWCGDGNPTFCSELSRIMNVVTVMIDLLVLAAISSMLIDHQVNASCALCALFGPEPYAYTSINTWNVRVTLSNFCLVSSSGLSCGTWPRPLRLSFIVPGRSPSARLMKSSSIGARDPEAGWYYCRSFIHSISDLPSARGTSRISFSSIRRY